MQKKSRILVIIVLLIFIIYGCGITYSIFNAGKNFSSVNEKTAQFIFNSEKTDHLEFDLSTLTPGETEEYHFKVTNTDEEQRSEVTINYFFAIKTYHFMPLDIRLYKVIDEEEVEIINCDETYSRDKNNYLICNSKTEEMKYSSEESDEYVLKVTFLKEYDNAIYSDLVDFIALDIKSFQKIGGSK